MPKKIKVIAKKTTQPDEFISASFSLTEYLKRNSRTVIRGAAMAILALLIVGGWILYNRGRENDAHHLFSQVMQEYLRGESFPPSQSSKSERYRSALEKFEDVEKRYSGTSSAIMALFYKGECAYNLGEYNKAIEYYTQFINRSKREGLKSIAFEGLGYCYEQKGEYDQALRNFKKALEEGGVKIKESDYLNIARCYEELNDKEHALEFYKKCAELKRGSPFTTLAQDKSMMLIP